MGMIHVRMLSSHVKITRNLVGLRGRMYPSTKHRKQHQEIESKTPHAGLVAMGVYLGKQTLGHTCRE